ncbi:unnamed protein product [Cylindrotheca closterium]|uniref:Uncharacterized protein n=1 Tax=Cylindrotheca closterium TaxID=2856 RepID=A0AAD2G7Z9_9STRA|nr:unnamed protein product [Cylindrotheca closterium]
MTDTRRMMANQERSSRGVSTGSMDDFLHVLFLEHNIVPSQVDIIQDNANPDDHTVPRRHSSFEMLSPAMIANKTRIVPRSLSGSSSSSSSTTTRGDDKQELNGFDQVLLMTEKNTL